MNNYEENDHFTVLENKSIGRNLSLFRKLRDKKALEVAEHVGLSEAAYTKYERGESKITIEMIQKVAEFLEVDPIMLLSVSPGSIIESVNNSPHACVSNYGSYNYQTYNEKQAEMMLTLMEKVIELLDKNK